MWATAQIGALLIIGSFKDLKVAARVWRQLAFRGQAPVRIIKHISVYSFTRSDLADVTPAYEKKLCTIDREVGYV